MEAGKHKSSESDPPTVEISQLESEADVVVRDIPHRIYNPTTKAEDEGRG
jgi:hypothetical protein